MYFKPVYVCSENILIVLSLPTSNGILCWCYRSWLVIIM